MSAVEPRERIIPLRGMRGMIADNMRRSLAEAAQLTHHAECDASALLRRKKRLTEAGLKVSLEDLLIRCTIDTLADHPALNGRVEDQEIRLSAAVHMSVAIALPDNGLVAPAIFEADAMSLEALAAARQDLFARARAGKLSVKEMTGGTFTISNLGLSRVRFFTPILNLPQIAILGLGQTARRPWVTEDGAAGIRSIMGLSLTFDHRAVDGAPAAQFLSALCEAIESCDDARG